MNANKEFVGTYFIIFLRIFVAIVVVLSIFFVIRSVAQGVPVANILSGTPSFPFILGFFFLMYGCFELLHHAEQRKKNAAMQEEHAGSSITENQQQFMTKHETSKKIGFWLGVCCGVGTTAFLLWLLFDRVLSGVFFS